MNRLPVIAFVLGLMAFSFGGGIVVTYLDWFPIPVLREAQMALDALIEQQESSPYDEYTFPVSSGETGVTINDRDRAYDGYTLITAYRARRCTNQLIDMDGNVAHEWYVPYSSVWSEAPFLLEQYSDDWTCWHGAHLYPNGDLLLSFAGTGFPEGWGVVKLDKDSRILWKLPSNTHHDIHVASDGRIYIPSMKYRNDGENRLRSVIGPPFAATVDWPIPLEEDVLLIVSPDGRILDEISMLDAIVKSPYRGLLSVNAGKPVIRGPIGDPTHLNNIETVSDEWAALNPFVNAGDIIVSFRNLSTVAALDRDSHVIKWSMAGPFIRQHDPDLLPNGNILIFDNWGGDEERGWSRIIEIDPKTHKIAWEYAGTVEAPFYTEIRGVQQKLPNGNVLITEPQGGRAFEVTPDRDGTVVWEYRNEVSDDGSGGLRIGTIVQAYRFAPNSLEFIDTHGNREGQ